MCVAVAAAGVALVVCVSTAHAQTDRRFGFVIAHPASVGVEWQAASRVAIRFDGGYRQSRVESEATPTSLVPGFPGIRLPVFEVRSSTSSRGADLGLSVLMDVYRNDDLRLYVAPRIGILLSSTEFETTITGLSPSELAAFTFPANRESTSSTPSGGVAVGASHDITPRFRIFGETGLSYSRNTIDGLAVNDVSQSSFGLRSGVGIVVLF